MPTSFDSTTQTKVMCDVLLPRVDTTTNALAVVYAAVGVVHQSRIHYYELSTAPYPPSSTVAAAGSSRINTTSTHGAQPFEFQPTHTILTRRATLSGSNVNVPSLATVANGASDVAAALPPAPYPPSLTVAAASTHGARPFSLQRIQMTPNRLATLSGARDNVPSSATAAYEAHGARARGLSSSENARSSLPTRCVTSSSAANANNPSNGSNAPRRCVRAKRPGRL
jgi:hypothetical protein